MNTTFEDVHENVGPVSPVSDADHDEDSSRDNESKDGGDVHRHAPVMATTRTMMMVMHGSGAENLGASDGVYDADNDDDDGHDDDDDESDDNDGDDDDEVITMCINAPPPTPARHPQRHQHRHQHQH